MNTPWPKYVSHKTVQALPIVRIEEATIDPARLRRLYVRPDPRGPLEEFEPTEAGMRNRCHVNDLAMIYRDGYRSVCPRKEFDDGYSPIEPTGEDKT